MSSINQLPAIVEKIRKIKDDSVLREIIDGIVAIKNKVNYDAIEKWLDKKAAESNNIELKLSHATAHRTLTVRDGKLIKITENSSKHIANFCYYFSEERGFSFNFSPDNKFESITDEDGEIIYRAARFDEKKAGRKFLLYYWRHNNKVGLATLTIFPEVYAKNHAGLVTFYYTEVKREFFCSSITETDSHIFIRFQNEQSEHLKKLILSQITIVLAEGDKMEDHYMLASYSTVHRKGEEGIAGLMIIEEIKPQKEKEIYEFIANYSKTDSETKVKDEIYYFLYNQRFIVNKIDKKETLPFIDEVRIIKKYCGTYQGYYIDYQTVTLWKYSFSLSSNGLVVCEYPNQTDEISGFVQYCNNSIMMIRFDYDSIKQFNRFYYMLKLPSDILETDSSAIDIKGIASGIDKGLFSPFSSRFFLSKLPENQKAEKRSFNQIDTKDFLGSSNKISSFLLSEEIDYMTDAFVKKKYEIHENKTTYENSANSFVGEYEFFFSGFTELDKTVENKNERRETRVYRHTLTIDENGKVVLKQDDLINCEGEAHLDRENKFLQIKFYNVAVSNKKKVGKGFDGIAIFSLKSLPKLVVDEVHHLFGCLIKFDDSRIQGLSCLISETHPDSPHQYQFYRNMDAVLYQNKEIWGFNDFDQYFNSGLLSFMEGANNRLLRLPQNANRPFRPRKKEFRRPYFFSSCNIALRYYKAKMSRPEKMNTYFSMFKAFIEDAYTHGFAANKFAGVEINKELLTESNSYLSKIFNAKDEYLSELLDDFQSLIEDREMLLEELNNKETFGQEEILTIILRLWDDIK